MPTCALCRPSLEGVAGQADYRLGVGITIAL
jgi:hypothetical protein